MGYLGRLHGDPRLRRLSELFLRSTDQHQGDDRKDVHQDRQNVEESLEEAAEEKGTRLDRRQASMGLDGRRRQRRRDADFAEEEGGGRADGKAKERSSRL